MMWSMTRVSTANCSGWSLRPIALLGGVSFIAENFLLVLAPRYNVPYVIAPMFLGLASLMLWLLVKGVDRVGWARKQAGVEGAGLAVE